MVAIFLFFSREVREWGGGEENEEADEFIKKKKII